MIAGRIGRAGRRRGVPALAVLGLVSGAALAGGTGPAAAAPGRPAAPGRRPATAAGTISTFAGGVGGPGPATRVSVTACGVTTHGGSMYIPDGPVVRKVSARGWLTTPAGDGAQQGARGTGGAATKAVLGITCGATVDHPGNLVIAENYANQIAVVAARTGTFYGQPMIKGHIYLVAGNGRRGYSQPGEVATHAPMSGTEDAAVDAHGNLVIANSGFRQSGTRYGSVLQVVAATSGTFYGQPMKAGHIYTVAGHRGGSGFSGDGGPAVKAALGLYISTVRVDRSGNLVLAETGNNRIRVVAARAGTFYGVAMKAGDIYTVAGDGTSGFSGDGGPATRARLAHPYGVALDPAGNLVVADSYNNRIRVIAARTGTFYGLPMKAGHIYTVAGDGTAGFSGDGGPAAGARLHLPVGVAVDEATGTLLIADGDNDRVRAVAARAGTFYGVAMKAGDIYTVAGTGTSFYSGDGGPATKAELYAPAGMAVNRAGDLFITDNGNSTVRMVAARTGMSFGQAMVAGDIYTVAGDGSFGFSGDGGPGPRAKVSGPQGVAVDGSGNAVIADSLNNRVRVVAARTGTFYGQPMKAGDIYTVAGTGKPGFSGDGGPAARAKINWPESVAVDGAGNLVIADGANNRVRVVAARRGTFYGRPMKAGDIYTVAGTGIAGRSGNGALATRAKLAWPQSVAVDGAGDLVLGEQFDARVRVVAARTGTFYGQPMKAGHIYTVAGTGQLGFSGDGGPATRAKLYYAAAVAIDAAGNLVIADPINGRVRVVAARTGTFYGVAMKAGDIYTVAGTGIAGFTGDGGPATRADLASPDGVAVNGAGDLFIADSGNLRVRAVTP